MRKKSLILISLFAALAIALSGCGDDGGNGSNNEDKGNNTTNNSTNNGNGGNASDLGSVSLSVSGEVSANRSGIADFSHMDLGAMQTWELSMNDLSPQTFSLTLMAMSNGSSVNRPSPGEYPIGAPTNEAGKYQVVYTHIENGDFANAVEYTTNRSGSGTLTIETSTDEKVTGSFEFSADRYAEPMDAEPVGTIQVSGSFEAKARQSL